MKDVVFCLCAGLPVRLRRASESANAAGSARVSNIRSLKLSGYAEASDEPPCSPSSRRDALRLLQRLERIEVCEASSLGRFMPVIGWHSDTLTHVSVQQRAPGREEGSPATRLSRMHLNSTTQLSPKSFRAPISFPAVPFPHILSLDIHLPANQRIKVVISPGVQMPSLTRLSLRGGVISGDPASLFQSIQRLSECMLACGGSAGRERTALRDLLARSVPTLRTLELSGPFLPIRHGGGGGGTMPVVPGQAYGALEKLVIAPRMDVPLSEMVGDGFRCDNLKELMIAPLLSVHSVALRGRFDAAGEQLRSSTVSRPLSSLAFIKHLAQLTHLTVAGSSFLCGPPGAGLLRAMINALPPLQSLTHLTVANPTLLHLLLPPSRPPCPVLRSVAVKQSHSCGQLARTPPLRTMMTRLISMTEEADSLQDVSLPYPLFALVQSQMEMREAADVLERSGFVTDTPLDALLLAGEGNGESPGHQLNGPQAVHWTKQGAGGGGESSGASKAGGRKGSSRSVRSTSPQLQRARSRSRSPRKRPVET